MQGMFWFVLKELRHDKRRAALLCMTVALAESGLYAILTLSAGYLRFFGEHAALVGKDALPLAWQGILDVGGMLLELLSQITEIGLVIVVKAEDILSGEAALKNLPAFILPAFILLSGLTVLIAVRCAVGLLFSVYRRQHRHFLTSLLVGGADAAFVDRFVRTESLFIWICAFPAAALFGTAQLTVLRRIAADWFSRNLGAQTPVDIR